MLREQTKALLTREAVKGPAGISSSRRAIKKRDSAKSVVCTAGHQEAPNRKSMAAQLNKKTAEGGMMELVVPLDTNIIMTASSGENSTKQTSKRQEVDIEAKMNEQRQFLRKTRIGTFVQRKGGYCRTRVHWKESEMHTGGFG